MKLLSPYCILTTIILLLCISVPTIAQEKTNLSMQWIENSQSIQWNKLTGMFLGQDSALYVAGNYSDTTKLGTKKVNGEKDIFLAKLSPEGKVLWDFQIHSPTYCHATTFAKGNKGQFYLAGYFSESLTLGEKQFTPGKRTDAFILSMDTTGKVISLTTLEGDFRGGGIVLQENTDNSLLVGINFYRYIKDLDSSYSNPYTGRDIFLLQLDKNGQAIHSESWQGPGDDALNHIACNPHGKTAYSVSFEKELQINGKNHQAKGLGDAMLVVRDHQMKPLWTRKLGSYYNDHGLNATFDYNEDLIFAGNYAGPMQSDGVKVDSCYGMLDVFVARFDKGGTPIWAEGFGSNGNDYLSDMSIRDNGDIFLSGSFRGKILHHDEEIHSVGNSQDIFVTKLNREGILRYMEIFGDSATDYGRKLVTDPQNFIYLSGNFSDKFKMHQKKVEADKDNFFMAKLYDCDNGRQIVLPNDTTICGEDFTITTDSSFTQYFWNQQKGGAELSPDTTGTYYLKAVDEFGCVSKDSIYIELAPQPVLELGEDIIVNKGDFLSLAPIFEQNVHQYIWDNDNEGYSIDIDTRNITPGIHTYILQVKNLSGCSSIDSVNVKIIEPDNTSIKVYPNPTTDFINLRINGLKAQAYQLRIFSQNGNIIYDKKHMLYPGEEKKLINVQGYAPGTYYLEVRGHNIATRSKFIIAH